MKHILIADDERDSATHDRLGFALAKAKRLGGEAATLEVVQTAYSEVPESATPMRESARDHLRARMHAGEVTKLREFLNAHDGVEGDVIWTKTPADAFVCRAEARNSELIVKALGHHSPLKDVFHTPTDWSLMRQATCPVLTVRDIDWKPKPIVLAAVAAEDVEHENLNRAILKAAGDVTGQLEGELHVVAVYPNVAHAIDQNQVGIDYEPMVREMRETRENAISGWQAELGLTIDKVHIIAGPAAAAIADLAAHIHADLVVLGTAGRSGVKRLFIGNTAEAVVARVGCDVMTLRSPDAPDE